MISLSVTEAARRFSDLINRVRYRGESALLLKGGKPVARVVPASCAHTGAELAKLWESIPHLDSDEAGLLESDLNESRRRLPAPSSKWD